MSLNVVLGREVDRFLLFLAVFAVQIRLVDGSVHAGDDGGKVMTSVVCPVVVGHNTGDETSRGRQPFGAVRLCPGL